MPLMPSRRVYNIYKHDFFLLDNLFKLSIKFNSIELTLGNDMEGMVVPLLLTKFSAAVTLSDWTAMVNTFFFPLFIFQYYLFFKPRQNAKWKSLLSV